MSKLSGKRTLLKTNGAWSENSKKIGENSLKETILRNGRKWKKGKRVDELEKMWTGNSIVMVTDKVAYVKILYSSSTIMFTGLVSLALD